MSINKTEWLVVGVNIGMEHYDDDNYEYFEKYAERNKPGEITYLIDGMSGKYFIVGEVIAYGDEYDGFELQEINLGYNQSVSRVKEFIRKEFDMGYEVEPKLIVLSHFT